MFVLKCCHLCSNLFKLLLVKFERDASKKQATHSMVILKNNSQLYFTNSYMRKKSLSKWNLFIEMFLFTDISIKNACLKYVKKNVVFREMLIFSEKINDLFMWFQNIILLEILNILGNRGIKRFSKWSQNNVLFFVMFIFLDIWAKKKSYNK